MPIEYSPQYPPQDALLALLTDPAIARIVQLETIALEHIVQHIAQTITQREQLGKEQLDALESRRRDHSSELLNLRTSHRDPRHILLEDRLEIVSQQTIETQTHIFRDILELKKLLWHYSLRLQQKSAHHTLVR